MRCLSDAEIQELVDAELNEPCQAHVAECRRCDTRVEERRRDMTTLSALMAMAGDLSAARNARIRNALNQARLAPRLAVVRTGSSQAIGWLGGQSVFDVGKKR